MFLQYRNMKQKTAILYTLKGKTQTEKVQILRKLYGYKDTSNYQYAYNREGELKKAKFTKEKKTVLKFDNTETAIKIAKLLKKLKIDFEIAKINALLHNYFLSLSITT